MINTLKENWSFADSQQHLFEDDEYKAESQTSDQIYTVKLKKDWFSGETLEITCDCKGFRFRGQCRHSKKVKPRTETLNKKSILHN